ncbi:MAG: M23 family metallopeptidase [Flavobacteriales bacterium]|nr:M23 family metallopeptidase [Flavobacteriales bacterium]
MPERKYRFNPKTLNFEPIRLSIWQRMRRIVLALTPGLLVGVTGIALVYQFVDSPKEAALKREIQQLLTQYEVIDRQLGEVEQVLSDMRRRDDNIYRVIFEADPLPETMRRAGAGGLDRYRGLDGYVSSDMVMSTRRRLDQLRRQVVVQSVSLDEVAALALRKQDMLAHIPSVQPIAHEDLKHVASGFGMRMHPIHKIIKFHAGLDFTAPVGKEIHATGDGRVVTAEYATNGYGMYVVIDHGYDYRTLYAHLSDLRVRPGQQVKRGDVIGRVGNTGLSSGPHLHYEVHKGGEAVDPANFLFNDLTPEEYAELVERSRNATQSFD